jgi:hypothetical protein
MMMMMMMMLSSLQMRLFRTCACGPEGEDGSVHSVDKVLECGHADNSKYIAVCKSIVEDYPIKVKVVQALALAIFR